MDKKRNFATGIPFSVSVPLMMELFRMFDIRGGARVLSPKRLVTGFFVCVCLMSLSANCLGQTTAVPVDSTRKKGKFFPSPLLGYTPETKWYFGAGFVWYLPPSKKFPNSNPSVIKAVAVYTTNKQIESNINGESWFRNNLYKLDYSTSYYKFPNSFYGIGNNTLISNRETYGFDFFNILLNAQRKTLGKYFVGGRLFLEHTDMYDIQPGGYFDSVEITGEAGGLNTGLGPWITYDTRDNIYFPVKGMIANISAVAHTRYLGSAYDYMHYEFEYSKFIKIFKNDVFAFNAYVECVPGEAPFNRLAALGGDKNMRGHFEGRYRDVNYATLQAEYRSTIWKYFGVTIFGGIGEVAPTLQDFSLSGLKYSYGIGGRLFIVPEDKVSLRVDYGMDGEGNDGVYITFREAF